MRPTAPDGTLRADFDSPGRRHDGRKGEEVRGHGDATKKTTTAARRHKAKAAGTEITYEMIAERAYHIAQSGEGGTDEENWHRAEAELKNA